MVAEGSVGFGTVVTDAVGVAVAGGVVGAGVAVAGGAVCAAVTAKAVSS